MRAKSTDREPTVSSQWFGHWFRHEVRVWAIVKYAYDHSSQLIGVIWFAVSSRGPVKCATCILWRRSTHISKSKFYFLSIKRTWNKNSRTLYKHLTISCFLIQASSSAAASFCLDKRCCSSDSSIWSFCKLACASWFISSYSIKNISFTWWLKNFRA